MPELSKATLQEITSDAGRTPVGREVEVQFNPTSLSLKLSNQIEGGDTRGRQARQYIGSSSSVLTVELVFDTADEGTTEAPRSVREKTTTLERFVLPQKAGAKETPPKLRFTWGELVFEGIVENLELTLEHFAHDGTPLRARVGLSVKEQDAEYQFLESGPGAGEAPGATAPGSPALGLPGSVGLGGSLAAGVSLSAGLGLSAGIGFGDQAVVALAGETPAQLAARVGLDPRAWRGLGADLSAGLSLDAGLEVGFSASLSAGGGLGLHAGAELGAEVSVEAAFGLEAEVNAGAGASFGGATDPALASGFALAAAGGVTSALESVAIQQSTTAADAARESFDVPVQVDPASRAVRPAAPPQPHTPLTLKGRPGGHRSAAAPAPEPPRADPRATSYGAGVPLRPRFAGTGEAGGIGRGSRPPVALVDTQPPWLALPPRDAGRLAADDEQEHRLPSAHCACHGSCSCGGHGSGRGNVP